MSHGNLYLLGDAAHIYSPTGGKGANAALYDAGIFAGAVLELVRHGRTEGLRAYSEVCLRHTWNYQEFSVWALDLLHDIGELERSGTSLTYPYRLDMAVMLPTECPSTRLISLPPSSPRLSVRLRELRTFFGEQFRTAETMPSDA